MNRADLIDPEARVPLDGLLQALPGGFNAIPDIVQRRAAVQAMLGAIEVPENLNVTKTDHSVPGPDGEPDITVRVYRPVAAGNGTVPGIYYIHGGGMILGDVAGEDATAAMISESVRAVVVSVEYRLAPEHPHPAPVEDCYAGLQWMAKNSTDLGFDPDRLAIYGGSAGGGLTLATALLARDRSGPALRFMMPIYPMIDDRNETASSREITDIGIWDRAGNIQAWDWYLGGQQADQYAAPSRTEDLTNRPPAWRLMQAGVPTELHINPGSYHAAETFAPESALAQRIWHMRIDALKRALN